MKKAHWLAGLLLFGASNVSMAADFIEVNKSATVSASVEQVWAKVGDFCAIQEWHPAIATCQAYDDHGTMYRNLVLEDGGKISEKHAGTEATSYSYYIKKSPLPVKAYKATFMAEADGDGTKITWKTRFKAKDATDEEAKGVIEGIFDAGLASIQEQFK